MRATGPDETKGHTEEANERKNEHSPQQQVQPLSTDFRTDSSPVRGTNPPEFERFVPNTGAGPAFLITSIKLKKRLLVNPGWGSAHLGLQLPVDVGEDGFVHRRQGR